MPSCLLSRASWGAQRQGVHGGSHVLARQGAFAGSMEAAAPRGNENTTGGPNLGEERFGKPEAKQFDLRAHKPLFAKVVIKSGLFESMERVK